MKTGRLFEEPVIYTEITLTGRNEPQEIDEKGILSLEEEPHSFNLAIIAPETAVITTRVSKKGSYIDGRIVKIDPAYLPKEFRTGCQACLVQNIQVRRAGQNVWVPWLGEPANKIDCWLTKKDGKLDLFQVGIITHDDGKTFRILGEYRWRGQLFRSFRQEHNGIAAKPADPKWGSFESRKKIVQRPDIREWLRSLGLLIWEGKDEELSPRMGDIPEGMARINWYSPFGGQTGQGIAILEDGSSAWIHGKDIMDEPNTDGIKRIYFNDLIKFAGIRTNDKGQNLLCVEKVKEDV